MKHPAYESIGERTMRPHAGAQPSVLERSHELALMDEAIETARRGTGSLVLIEGEPGLIVLDEGQVVATGTHDELHETSEYYRELASGPSGRMVV